MKKVIVAVAALAATLVSTVTAALTIEALPGSAPQSTRANAYFPSPIGVLVRDDAGAPAPNINVYFYNPFGEGEPRLRFLFPYSINIKTDANGIAVTTQIAADTIAGPARLSAYAGQVSVDFAPLTILPGPATNLEFELPNGQGQWIRQGHPFDTPWTLRAVDADGLPVPHAIVSFNGRAQPGPYVLFNGSFVQNAAADAEGVVRSPASSGGAQLGHGWGQACAFQAACQWFEFFFVDFPPPAAAYLMRSPFFAVQEGRQADQPFRILAVDAMERPMAGVPVNFKVPPCGTFEGAANVTVITDATGYASSPLFRAVASGPSKCELTIDIGGHYNFSWYIPMLVFRGEDVTVFPYPGNYLEATRNEPFEFSVYYFTLDETGASVPIDGRPVRVQVVESKHSGASADLVEIPPFVQDTTYFVTIKMKANNKHGTYMIGVTRDEVVQWFHVDQRKR